MGGQASLRARQLLDLVVYACVLSGIVFGGATVVSFAFGWGWVGVKFILFFTGIGLFGIGTFKLRPTPPWKDERLPSTDGVPLQSTLQRLPPLDQYGVSGDQRLSVGAKLLLSSLLILGVSFALETVFGVAR